MVNHLRRDVRVNSASHQTRTTRTFFSCLCHTALMRTSHGSSLVHKIVIWGPRCHVTLWHKWVCVLFILLHTFALAVPLFIRHVTEPNYHCRSAQREVWPNRRLDLKHILPLTGSMPSRTSEKVSVEDNSCQAEYWPLWRSRLNLEKLHKVLSSWAFGSPSDSVMDLRLTLEKVKRDC